MEQSEDMPNGSNAVWINSSEKLEALKEGKRPAYAEKPVYISLLEDVLKIDLKWVNARLCGYVRDGIDIGGAPGEIFYDQGQFWCEQNCPEHTFLHDLCHAIVARGKRGNWRDLPNFGCPDNAYDEEVETCWLQFYIMWSILKLPTEEVIGVMDEYNFFQEVHCDYNGWEHSKPIRQEAKNLVDEGKLQFKKLLSRDEHRILTGLAKLIPNVDRRKK